MQLTNEWISGFVDGEGCFNIQKIKAFNNTQKKLLGERVTKKKTQGIDNNCFLRHRFIVSQDKRSVNVLYGLKRKLKCGTVHKAGAKMMAFQVIQKSHLENIIIPFFQKNGLKTTKRESFRLFVESLKNIKQKQYTDTVMGIEKQKSCLSSSLSCAFVRDKKIYSFSENIFAYNFSDNWFRGFVDAEGCFSVSLVKDYPRPQLIIALYSKEKQLLVELQKFLKCGTLRTRKDGAEILQIVSSKDLERYIFPKLQTKGGAVLLQSSKRISYMNFRKIVRLIMEKKHKTVQGLEKIKKYKGYLNKQNSLITITKTEKEIFMMTSNTP